MDALKTENQRLKDENGALIRVISKLSKWSKWNLNLIEEFLRVGARSQFERKKKVSYDNCFGMIFWLFRCRSIPLKKLFHFCHSFRFIVSYLSSFPPFYLKLQYFLSIKKLFFPVCTFFVATIQENL